MSLTTDKEMLDFLTSAIELRLKVEADKLIEEAKKDLEKRTPEIVTSVVVDIMKFVDFQMLQDRIVFTIRKKD